MPRCYALLASYAGSICKYMPLTAYILCTLEIYSVVYIGKPPEFREPLLLLFIPLKRPNPHWPKRALIRSFNCLIDLIQQFLLILSQHAFEHQLIGGMIASE